MYQMEKSQQVRHTPRQRWKRAILVPAVAGQGFPVSVGGNSVLGSLLFGLLIPGLTCICKSERPSGGTGE